MRNFTKNIIVLMSLAFTISFNANSQETQTFPIYFQSTEDIAGFQFNLEGAEMSGVSGGEAALSGFTIYAEGNTALGFSFGGNIIPAGEGTLVLLDVSSSDVSDACINNVILSNISGNPLGVYVENCNTIVVGTLYGCTDPSAVNYNNQANLDDGSCAGVDDGSCQYGEGGFDFEADSLIVWKLEYDENCNGYSGFADIIYSSSGTASYGINWSYQCGGTYTHTFDDNSTVYTGLWDGNQITGTFTDAENTFSGCFTLKKMGCTNVLATIYDPVVILNDNSCSYECDSPAILNTNSGEYDEEIGLVITSSLNDTIFAFSQGNPGYDGFGISEIIEGSPIYNAGVFDVCLDPEECYTIKMTDYYGDGWNGAYFTLNDESFSLPSGSEISYNYGQTCEEEVCTDSLYSYDLSQGSNFGVSLIDFNSNQTLYSVAGGSTGGFCLNPDGCYVLQLSNSMGDTAYYDYVVTIENQEFYFDQGEVIGGGAYSSIDPFLTTFSDIFGVGCIISGCTDSLSDNFNEMAVVNDGSCQLYEIGCMDSLAFNYNNQALLDDGSCTSFIEGCIDPNVLNYNPDANVDDGSCITPIACEEGLEGLIISMEDSYGDGWNGNLYSLVNASGEVVATGGLTNAVCPDFSEDQNPWAQCEESESRSDVLCVPAGCYAISVNGNDYITETSWSVSTEYNGVSIANGGGYNNASTFGLSTDDDCSQLLGCTDSASVNYNSSASINDGSCSCPLTPGGIDVTETDCYEAVMYNSYSISEMTELGYDCTCVENPIYGCMDPLANNYDSLANMINDTDCFYTIDCNTPFVHNASLINYENNSLIIWDFTSENGEDLKIDFAGATNDGDNITGWDCSFNGNGELDFIYVWEPGESTPTKIYGCLEEWNASFEVPSGTSLSFHSDDTGTEAFSFSVSLNVEGCVDTLVACMDVSATNYNPIADIADDSLCEYNGCTDLLALNYDSSATQDDSSCIYVIEGCMDSLACNYNDVATEDNGSCYNNDLGCGCDLPAASDGYDCDGNCLSGELLTMTADYGDPTINWYFYDGPGGGGGDGFGWYGAVLTINGVDYTLESGLSATTCIDLLDCNTVSWTPYDSYVFASSFIGGVPDGVSMSAAWSVGDLSGGEDGSGSGAYGDCGITGCTDVLASNFDSFANIDDGSCVSWEELTNSLQSELDNVVPEDGVSQEDIDILQVELDIASYVISNLELELNEALLNQSECNPLNVNEIDVYLFMPEGWSMFGYTCNNSLNTIDALEAISDKIIIVKDYNGSVYMTEFNFNGIGNLNYGEGYQIKLTEQVYDFQFCPQIQIPE